MCNVHIGVLLTFVYLAVKIGDQLLEFVFIDAWFEHDRRCLLLSFQRLDYDHFTDTGGRVFFGHFSFLQFRLGVKHYVVVQGILESAEISV